MERVLLTAPSFSSVNSELSYLSSDIVNDLTYLVRVFNFIKRKKLEQSYCKKKMHYVLIGVTFSRVILRDYLLKMLASTTHLL